MTETKGATILERLHSIQMALKAPKGQYNKFGSYNYRSCEDILEALKPLLTKEGLTLRLSDSIEPIGDRYYVKAVALVEDASGAHIGVSAFAREEDTRKGMGADQLTGAASSYARKYALNGMFLIDDTKDSDATNEHEKTVPVAAPAPKATVVRPQATAGPQAPAPMTPGGAVQAEAIHKMTATKLLSAMKLKGVTEKADAARVLDLLSRKDYGKTFMALDEDEAHKLVLLIANPMLTAEDLEELARG